MLLGVAASRALRHECALLRLAEVSHRDLSVLNPLRERLHEHASRSEAVRTVARGGQIIEKRGDEDWQRIVGFVAVVEWTSSFLLARRQCRTKATTRIMPRHAQPYRPMLPNSPEVESSRHNRIRGIPPPSAPCAGPWWAARTTSARGRSGARRSPRSSTRCAKPRVWWMSIRTRIYCAPSTSRSPRPAGSAPPPTHRLSSALAQRIARVTTG